MRSNKTLHVVGILLCLTLFIPTRAQSDDVPRYEVGAQFTSITKPDYSGGATEAGFGGRFTFNFNRSLALEATGNFFPHNCFSCGLSNGNITQGLFGVKVGKRFQRWGIFGKARPGVVSFSKVEGRYEPTGGAGPFPFQFVQRRLTNFALDVGGVIEFYPSKRIVTRFEAGDTLIRYRSVNTNFVEIDGVTGVINLVPYTIPRHWTNNFQFMAGVGFRF